MAKQNYNSLKKSFDSEANNTKYKLLKLFSKHKIKRKRVWLKTRELTATKMHD